MRKMISKLLLLTMLLSFVPITYVRAQPRKGDLTFKKETLISLSILDESINLDSTVLRGEWAIILYNILNYKNGIVEPESAQQIFEDIDTHHYLNGYLTKLYYDGIINGVGDGNFHSEQPVRCIDVYNTLLRIAGYSEYMANYEGYNDGIIAAAKIADLDIVDSYGAEITYSKLISILYDVLFAKCMVLNFEINNGNVAYSIGNELISEVMGLRYIEGILTAAGTYSLTGNAAGNNPITIDGYYSYDTTLDTKNIAKSLGKKVLCFLDKEDTVIAVIEYEVESVTIYAEDITDPFANNTYYVEVNNKKKKYTLENGFYIQYNKRVPTGIINMNPQYGSVELIDNDNNGRFDVALITESQILYVNGVNVSQNEMYVEDVNKKKSTIELSDFDEIRMTSSGIESDISSIQKGTIIAFSKSLDGEYAGIEIYREHIVGALTSFGEDSLEVDGVVYEKGSQMYAKNNFAVGNKVEVIIDEAGKVIAILQDGNVGKQVMYLMKVYYDFDTETARFKGLTENGIIEQYYCAKKVRLDGVSFKDHEILVGNFQTENNGAKQTNQQLISIEFNGEGKIKMIDTASSWNAVSSNNDSLKTRHISSGWYKFFGSFNNEILVNDNTRIFSVPSTNSDDRMYSVKTKNDLVNDKTYVLDIYRTGDEELAYEEYIVMKDQDFNGNHNGIDILVQKIKTEVNDDNDIVECIYGMEGSKEVRYETDGYYTLSDKGFDRGDVLTLTKNMEGKVENALLQYKNGDNAVRNTYSFNDGYRMIGYTHDVIDNVISLGLTSGADADLRYNDNLKNVVVYDVAEKKAHVGSLSEAKTYIAVGNMCSKVYVQTIGAEPYFIVIYLD